MQYRIKDTFRDHSLEMAVHGEKTQWFDRNGLP